MYPFVHNNPSVRYDLFGLTDDEFTNVRLPKPDSGFWSGPRGNSRFYSGALADNAKFKNGILFVDHVPDLKEFSKYTVSIDGFSGDREADKRAAIRKLRQNGTGYQKRTNYQWHHFKRGNSFEMQYVPKAVNSVAHTGPHAAARNQASNLKGAAVGGVVFLTGLLIKEINGGNLEQVISIRNKMNEYMYQRANGRDIEQSATAVACGIQGMFGDIAWRIPYVELVEEP